MTVSKYMLHTIMQNDFVKLDIVCRAHSNSMLLHSWVKRSIEVDQYATTLLWTILWWTPL